MGQNPNEANYEKTLKDNEMFEKFYQGLNLMPSEEWYYFYRRLQDPLPVTFRITGYRSHARQLLHILQSKFFDSLVGKMITISDVCPRNSIMARPAKDLAISQSTQNSAADPGALGSSSQSSAPLLTVPKKEADDANCSTAAAASDPCPEGVNLNPTDTTAKEEIDVKVPIVDSTVVNAPLTAAGDMKESGWGDPPVTDTPGRDAVVIGTGLAGWDRGAKRSASPKEPMKVEQVKPPKCLPWYPDELAWQIDLSRKVVRSQEVLSRLHDFLVSETETGYISRQEAVSMIPPLVLDIQSNSRVLDLCAAPGSKTAQLIEYLHKEENTIPEGFVVANDKDSKRCYLMVHQVKRLSSPCFMIVNHDAAYFPRICITPKGEKPEFLTFDRVLADVPCSGDGTMRKNIDIWRKWSPIMGVGMHSLQLKILRRGLEQLEVGGRLVYSTCSMHPVEDEAVIAEMLRKCHGTVELVDISSLLPGLKTVDGLSQWKLMTKFGVWIENHEQVPPQLKSQLLPSMFPPTDEEAGKFNLHRCVRILPHHQDTGGFFIAAMTKTQHLPWSHEARLEKEKQTAETKQSEEEETEPQTGAGAADSSNSPAVTEGAASADVPTDAGDNIDGDALMEDCGSGSGLVPWGSGSITAADTRKRRGGKAEGPSSKKKMKLQGYREDPFLFLQPEDSIYPPIKDFYGLGDDFPMNQLLYRCEEGPKRSLYFVSKAIRQIVLCNTERIRFINMGVKTFSRSPSPIVPDCDYRLAQECMGSLSNFFVKRMVPINKADAITILTQENPYFCKLSENTQQILENLEAGSVMFQFNPTESDPEPACNVTFCGWRGRASVRSFVPRFERQHCLRLFGEDLHKINAEVQLKKQQKLAASAAESDTAPGPTQSGDASGKLAEGGDPDCAQGVPVKREHGAAPNGDADSVTSTSQEDAGRLDAEEQQDEEETVGLQNDEEETG